MADVLVSYSYARPDRDAAFEIAAFLERQGISCWIAPRDVPAGMEQGAAVLSGIATSRALLLVLSEHADAAQAMRPEVVRAIGETKPVLSVRFRETTPSGPLEFFVVSAQWVDEWRAPMEQHLLHLARAIKIFTRAAGAPPSPRPPAPAPTGPTSTLRLTAASVILLLAIVGVSLVTWAPWRPAWQRNGAQFLVGSWCQPMPDGTIMRTDFAGGGANMVVGEFHVPHRSDAESFRARVSKTEDGFELAWLRPVEAVRSGPTRYRVNDDASMSITFAGGKQQGLPPLTRCVPNKGS